MNDDKNKTVLEVAYNRFIIEQISYGISTTGMRIFSTTYWIDIMK